MLFLFFWLFHQPLSYSKIVPLQDNVVFAFEKCKSLSVDLEKGLLVESVSPSFDLHCKKVTDSLETNDFLCDFFSQGGNKKNDQKRFSGGSELGNARLLSDSGMTINFLVGKKYASFVSSTETGLKMCAGFFLYEKELLKKNR
jgi:hypothetical protein